MAAKKKYIQPKIIEITDIPSDSLCVVYSANSAGEADPGREMEARPRSFFDEDDKDGDFWKDSLDF